MGYRALGKSPKREKRKKLNFTTYDHVYREEKHLSLNEYAIVDEVFRKQKLSPIPGKCKGVYWGTRKELAKSKHVSIDVVDKLVTRKKVFEQDEHGHLKVNDWKPNLVLAKENGNYSIIYHDMQDVLKFPEHIRLTNDEQCLMNLIGYYCESKGVVLTWTNSMIADKLKMSERSIGNYLSRLEKKGWLDRSSDGKIRYLSYRVHPIATKIMTWIDFVKAFQYANGMETEIQRKARLDTIAVLKVNNITVPEDMNKAGYEQRQMNNLVSVFTL